MPINNNKPINGDSRVNGSRGLHQAAEHLLTVAIPNYNYGCYLKRAIDSIIAQDYSPIELIVIDDGSTDNSVAVAEEKLAAQHRLEGYRIIALERNRGKLGAINAAIELARGRYFIILDADDWLSPHYASRCITELRKYRMRDKSAGFVYTDCQLVDVNGRFIDRGRSTPYDRDLVGRLSFLPEPALTLTAALREAAPFDETVRRATKHHKWCRIVANGWNGHYVPEPLFFYRMHSQNMSGIGHRVLSEAEKGSRGERILSGYWQVSNA